MPIKISYAGKYTCSNLFIQQFFETGAINDSASEMILCLNAVDLEGELFRVDTTGVSFTSAEAMRSYLIDEMEKLLNDKYDSQNNQWSQ